ncbi:MAG: hypothetical protein ACLFV8_14835, partial [Alphaproteobacteria bacterium]
MMDLRPFAPAVILAVLAMLGTVTNTDAARKTWAQECNEKPRDQRDRCCTTKTLDCYAACFEQFGRDGYRSDQCLRLCKSESEVCHKSIDKTSIPGRSGTATQAPKFNRSQVCCRTGRRHARMSARDCRARRGRSVAERFCRKSTRRRDHRTPQKEAAICCKRGARTWLTTKRNCR